MFIEKTKPMDSLYSPLLVLHSWNRWAILIFALFVIVSSVSGLSRKTGYSVFQKKSLFYYILTLHLQLLGGLILYFVLSPVTTLALNDFGAAMKDSTARFWAVEHAFVNVVAVVIAQAGSIITKRKSTDRGKHRSALIWTVISIVLIFAMIPFGMMGVERPWFRF